MASLNSWKFPNTWLCVSNAGHTSSLSIALIKADNFSAIGSCNSGKMPSPVKFKTALAAKNCDRYGLKLKKTAKSTKNSTTKSISHFYPKFGQNTLERFGTSKNQRFSFHIKACVGRLSLYSARLLVWAILILTKLPKYPSPTLPLSRGGSQISFFPPNPRGDWGGSCLGFSKSSNLLTT